MANKTPEQTIRDAMSAAASTPPAEAQAVVSTQEGKPQTAMQMKNTSALPQAAAQAVVATMNAQGASNTTPAMTQAQADAQTTQEATGKIYKVQSNGSAPAGLSVGDRVVTGGGTYEILAVNADGTYKSQRVDANQTTENYKGDYASFTTPTGKFYRVQSDGWAPKGLSVGDQVVTEGGTFIIDAVNPDGTYQSTRVNANQTTESFRGDYSVVGAKDPETIKNPADDLKTLLDQWLAASKEQSANQIDYATQQGVDELNRAMEDAAPKFQTQRNQTDVNEARALDNAALYAAARGDRGGIGQAQYNEIQAAAMQNRQAINTAQTKLATDTARQIADLRAKGEFEKADALLQLTQQQLSQLISLEQWGAEYMLSKEQMQQSLEQWQKEYELSKANVTGYFTDGTPTQATTESAREAAANIASALLEAGVMPSTEQLEALGMTQAQAQSYITAKGLQAASYSSSSSGSSRTSSSSGTSSGSGGDTYSPGESADSGSKSDAVGRSTADIKKVQSVLGVAADGVWGPKSQAALDNSGFSFSEVLSMSTRLMLDKQYSAVENKYPSVATATAYWDEINRLAESEGYSKTQLKDQIEKWQKSGKITEQTAKEMKSSFKMDE